MWTRLRKWFMPEIYDDTYFKPNIDNPYDMHPPTIDPCEDDPKPTWPKEESTWTYSEYKKMKEQERKDKDASGET